MVSESALADVLSVFSANATPAHKSHHHVGPMVFGESRLRRGLRRGGGLFLWMGRAILSRAFVFFLHWPASGWRALDPGALHKRSRTGDVQLLWPDQSAVSEHGLPQRTPRSAVHPLEQSAESALARTGILRYPEISFIMELVTFSIYFRQAIQFVLAHRAHEAEERVLACVAAYDQRSVKRCCPDRDRR